MKKFTSLLAIDCQKVSLKIEEFIKGVVDAHSANGVIIGLSGGIDSAVLATLSVRALGKDKVSLFYLYDRDSEKGFRIRAEILARWLDWKLEVVDIEPAMRKKGLYQPEAMKIIAFSSLFNRLLNRLYFFLFQESPFLLTISQKERGENWLKGFLFSSGILPIERSFNIRHRYRREVLEAKGREKGLILLGATNRSEYEIGWFVKDGIDDLPISPLLGLYKTQIRALANYLGLPKEVIDQKPSPDMMKGITDESVLGISYEKIDLILSGLNRNLSEEEIMTFGVRKREIFCVRRLKELSSWRREKRKVLPFAGAKELSVEEGDLYLPTRLLFGAEVDEIDTIRQG